MKITSLQMKKALLLIALLFILGTFASGCASPSAPAPAPVTSTPLLPVTETKIVVPTDTAIQPETESTTTISAPPGLEIVYLREGNIWSWTQTSGNVLITNTGDLSVVRLSNAGQLLAFMRGREVWTVHMDGKDPRLVTTQESEGGALWFAPNASLLAVSTADHIDVINLNNGTTSTVLTYPALPGGFYPEIIWSTDVSGLKTVIPPNSDTGEAEFLFLFPNGTKASLAKFSMVPSAESQSFISPDGGYVIYVTRLADGKEALNLMDSSGATRPYGEPSGQIRAYGWLPGSKHFVYAWENEKKTFLGDVSGKPPMTMAVEEYGVLRWLSAEYFLATQGDNLYLGNINGGKTLISEGVSDFDFVK